MKVIKKEQCLFCKKEYEFDSQSWQAKPYNKTFCSKNCKQKYRWNETQEYIQSGKPLIKIFDDFIQCTICGKKMTAASTHFSSTHGLPLNKKLTKLERQAIYGVPQGTRMVAKTHLQDQRDRAIKDGFSLIGKKFAENNLAGKKRNELPKVPASDKQQLSFRKNVIETEKHGSNARREQGRKARAERLSRRFICKGCNKEFHTDSYHEPMYCTIQCAYKHVDRKNVSDEQRKRMSEIMKKVRAEKKWSLPRKVTDEEIAIMAELTEAPKNKHGKVIQKVIGKKYGVGQSYVSQIRLGKISR